MRLPAILLILLVFIDLPIALAKEPCVQNDPLHRQDDLVLLDSVITPLWQTAWLARDWNALFGAGDELVKFLPTLANPKYVSHNKKKFNNFKTHCDTLQKLISEYRTAAGKKDSVSISRLLPRIKAELDTTKAGLQPIPYPGFDRLHCQVEQFVAERRDNKCNSKCQRKTTDKILTLLAKLNTSKVPEEISKSAELMREEFVFFNKLGGQIKAALVKGDQAQYELQLTQLQVRLNNFMYFYLQ